MRNKVNTGETIGMIRQCDDLGRVVLPKEYRRQLGMLPGSNVEMFLLKDGVFVKKVEQK